MEQNFPAKTVIDRDFQFVANHFTLPNHSWNWQFATSDIVTHSPQHDYMRTGYIKDGNNKLDHTLIIPKNFLNNLTPVDRRFYFAGKFIHHQKGNNNVYNSTVLTLTVGGAASLIAGVINAVHGAASHEYTNLQMSIPFLVLGTNLIAASNKAEKDEAYFERDRLALNLIGNENLGQALNFIRKEIQWITEVRSLDSDAKQHELPPGRFSREVNLSRYSQSLCRQCPSQYVQY